MSSPGQVIEASYPFPERKEEVSLQGQYSYTGESVNRSQMEVKQL
jgi:hypothetical protein